VHDQIFARRSGLERLLYCPTPHEFDGALDERIEKSNIVSDLVDYQLRHAQHGGQAGQGNISHAVFFNVWPTYNIPGKRGVINKDKYKLSKTILRWAREFHDSAIFIYLNNRQQYSQVPDIGDISCGRFTHLFKAANDVDELRRFFGAYAYISETIQAAGGERPCVAVPTTVPRVKITTDPFSHTELRTIADYNKYGRSKVVGECRTWATYCGSTCREVVERFLSGGCCWPRYCGCTGACAAAGLPASW
jgi:hypothetical protein